MEFRKAEIEAVANLLPEAQKIVKHLKGRKTNAPRDAYFFLASVPAEMLVFIEVELPNPRALSKIRNYMQKWRPLRLGLPMAELDALGVPRGPKFDKIIEQIFDMQLRGKARTPELLHQGAPESGWHSRRSPEKARKEKTRQGRAGRGRALHAAAQRTRRSPRRGRQERAQPRSRRPRRQHKGAACSRAEALPHAETQGSTHEGIARPLTALRRGAAEPHRVSGLMILNQQRQVRVRVAGLDDFLRASLPRGEVAAASR